MPNKSYTFTSWTKLHPVVQCQSGVSKFVAVFLPIYIVKLNGTKQKTYNIKRKKKL